VTSPSSPRLGTYEKIKSRRMTVGATRQLADGCPAPATGAAPTTRFFHSLLRRGPDSIGPPGLGKCSRPGRVLDMLRSPEGGSYSSRGQRPRKLASPIPDPEGVDEKSFSQQCLTPRTRLCDPCRVGRWVGHPSGGVAPGYCLMPFQGVKARTPGLGVPATVHRSLLSSDRLSPL